MNQYLETIELRTTGQNREKLAKTLEELMAGLNAHPAQENMQTYNSLIIEHDFCLHLHVLSENPIREGSPLGIRIVSILKEFGLISHNIWCEMSPNPSGLSS